MTLFRKVVVVNALLVTTAAVALALSPVTISSPLVLTEAVVLGAGVAAMVVADWILLRRAFAPLEELKRIMACVDPLRPGQRVAVAQRGAGEFAELADTFNAMLERLETERRDSARRAYAAEEGERRRLSRDLHDEIGQRLGALLLGLQKLSLTAPPALRERIESMREDTRSAMEEVRTLTRRLRPEALDQLGLASALAALTTSVGRAGLQVHRRIATDLPELSQDEELAVYRVAQEALSNTTRHAATDHASLALDCHDGTVRLVVADRGAGFAASSVASGQGIRSMRERALTIGARLDIDARPGAGTTVRLTLQR